ncbi:MAG: TolC family protein [Bryobacteraceae bacterium]
MFVRVFALVGALLGVLPGWTEPGRAQTPGGPAKLTLAEALALAEGNNPQLRAAMATTEGARAGIVTARAYPNPEVNVMEGGQHSRLASTGPGAPGLLQHYSFHQPIDLPRHREARINTAELRYNATEYGLDEARLAVRAAVKQTFYQALQRREEVVLAEENVKLIEDFRRRIQVQVEVGEAARLELTRAEAEVATAVTLERAAQLRLLTALAELRTVVSAPLPPNLELVGELDPAQAMPALDDLRKTVLSRHPSISQSQAEVRRAEAQLRTERVLRVPAPAVHAEYEQQPDLRFYRFGISVPVPLWNRREGPIGEATAAVNQARAYADLLRLRLTAQLERAYGQWEVATQQVEMYETGVLREAEAALRAAEAAYKFGERGIVEVLDAQRVLRAVRTDFLNARFDRQAGLVELERLRAVELQP